MSKEGWFTDDIDDQSRYSKRRNTNYNMITRNNSIPGIYEDEQEDDEKPRFCPHCEQYGGMQNKLGARIVPYGEEPQPDHDLWMSCYVCGKTFPKHEQKFEQKIEGFAEVSDNPFDDQKGHIESIPKRTSPAGKKRMEKRRRERERQHDPDPEIDELLRIYGDNVKVIK